MKDMPVEQPEGLMLDSYLPREDVRDAFVSLGGACRSAAGRGGRHVVACGAGRSCCTGGPI
jgi:hydroxymethylbilane synthase